MGILISYTFIAGIILLALYLAYGWLMADDNQPRFNRAVLLGCYATAALLPLLYFIVPDSAGAAQGAIEFGRPTVGLAADTDTGAATAGWPAIVAAIYLVGVAVILLRTFIAWVRLRTIISTAELYEEDGFTLAVTADPSIAPFSWSRYIVMTRDDYRDNRELILLHESIHLGRCHRYDLIVARLFEIFLWYNPASWLMTAALRSVHEYEADRGVVETAGVSARDYQMLLIKKAVGRSFPVLANSLNHSNLKKRITMMLKSKSRKARRVRVLALAPALAVAAISVNLPFMASALDTMSAYAVPSGIAGKVSEKPAQLQNAAAVNSQTDDEEVLRMVEVKPSFPGGEKAMMEWLMYNIKYPESEMNNVGKHRVIVQFVVKKDGSVGDVTILRGQSKAFDNEAVRVVRSMPNFSPGMVDGKPVNVYYTLPVVFSIVDDTPKAK